jgi:hypothetical protein
MERVALGPVFLRILQFPPFNKHSTNAPKSNVLSENGEHDKEKKCKFLLVSKDLIITTD